MKTLVSTRAPTYGNAKAIQPLIYAGAHRRPPLISGLCKMEWSILLLLVFAADAVTAAFYVVALAITAP
jgi:hypothetical protein